MNRSKILRKFLVSFMTFVFFYLVIGELIIIHQKMIFDYDAFANHPMSKPDKTGKEKIYKLKDKNDKLIINLITYISRIVEFSEIKNNIEPISFEKLIISVNLIDCKYSPISFRGPPAIL